MAIVGIVKPSKLFSKFPRFRTKVKKFKNPYVPLETSSKGSLETKFRQVFRFFDSNDDGKISSQELRSYFVSMGENMSYDEAQRVIDEFDRNGDGLLEFTEFVKMMQKDGENDNNEDEDNSDVKRAFEMFEVEKGRGITAKGVQQVLNKLGDEKSDEECEAMIRVFDLDGNGVLDIHEFHKMMA